MNQFEEDRLNNASSSSEVKKFKSDYPGQYLLTFLLFLGLINAVTLRLNLNIAVIEMTSNKTVIVNNKTVTYPPEFQWDSKTKGIVTSSLLYGYLSSPVTGYMTGRIGGVRAFGIGIIFLSAFAVISPFCLRLNFYLFLVIRIIEGIGEALCYTSVSDIWSRWSAPENRSKFLSLSYTGVYLGALITFPICGYIGHKLGWAAIFYLTGAIGFFWCIPWIFLTSNDPPSKNSSVRQPNDNITYPWKKLFTSRPVLILGLCKFAYGWGYNIIAACLPLYVKDILNLNTSHTGLLSAIPNLFGMFSVPLTGYLLDLTINKKWLTTTQAHKLFAFCGLLTAAISIFLIHFTNNFIIIMVYLILFKIFLTIAYVITQVQPLYVAPRYASGVVGISAVWYTVSGIAAPTFVGFVVTHSTSAQWDIVFMSTGGIVLIGSLIFLFFSSSEPLPWAVIEKSYPR